MSQDSTLEKVREYYGKVLRSRRDLKTSACCTTESVPEHIRSILAEIHPEVLDKFYGCGSPIPPLLDGLTVLDLGSGSGRDSFILSKLVGPTGKVIGVDMTGEQAETAQRQVAYHTQKFGYSRPNVEFFQGYIEDLESIGIGSHTVDLVVSNCVINLSPDKRRVFAEVFRVLKPGGEFYFSDVFADRRIPKLLAEDPVLLGECLGGALYAEDFRRMLDEIGCRDFRLVSKSKISLLNPDVDRKIGMVNFSSLTLRAFKIELEDRCEDYGQVAYYLGTIPEYPHTFTLDDHHVFQIGQPVLVCGNTADMLSQTRFAPHFKVIGEKSRHFGLFDCGPASQSNAVNDGASGACC